ncbi:MAG: hypothetical protein RIT27_2257 [Pseudomonadota bacterium]|jgi:uncharacterized protein (TIGR02001 family)
MKSVSTTILSTAMVGLLCGNVYAAEKIGDVELTGNFAVVSDYVWRGISQTNKKAAVQGGFDLSHPIGVYVGTWLSNVSGSGGNLETDYYGGYRLNGADLSSTLEGTGLDVGAIRYAYPGSTGANMNEIYAKASYKILTLGYSFSNKIPAGGKSHYVSIGASYPLIEGITLSGNVGRSKFSAASSKDYTDWNIGLSKDFAGLSFALTYTDTTIKDKDDPNNLAGSRILAGVSKKF